ncbi:tRNA pseudouridine(55) synthase TruB [Virgibacillus kekensis]|uniref:tRNA pseudouridine synthase B n=1 Tax=Virgibacillus kekensis TaxID=202261 RepID=A0ABV9DFK4_9BACI
MNGILPLWKPRGMTSHDCVVKARRMLHTKKVGHTGTLDPEVEGVLPLCIGQATKIVPYLTDTHKTYIAEVKLGTATETEDSHGEIIEEAEISDFPSKQAIENVLQLFRGEITQIPPMYSAVKVQGKKLYEYARNNEEVDRPSRRVLIYDLDLLSTDYKDSFIIKVTCSKGTYIRTLCVDIGKNLGYPSHMANLVRTSTGSISKKDTVTFEEIEKAINADKELEFLLPLSRGLSHLKFIEVEKTVKQRVLYGQKLPRPDEFPETGPAVIASDNRVLAVYQIHPDNPELIKPLRVFNE